MKSIKNEKLIKRNAKIGQWTSLIALVILGAGMYFSLIRQDLVIFSPIALIVGFILTQISMYMGNRWGRSPRPDEKLDSSLKGLPDEYSLYHYTTPVSHLLVGPAGVWIVKPYHQRGKITFAKNRWRNTGGGFMQGYMRIFGQEGLGRPDLEAESEIQTLKKFFAKHTDETSIPEIQPIMVFTDDSVELDVTDSPIPGLKLKQLKEFFRQKTKNRALTSLQIKALTDILSPSA